MLKFLLLLPYSYHVITESAPPAYTVKAPNKKFCFFCRQHVKKKKVILTLSPFSLTKASLSPCRGVKKMSFDISAG